MTYALRVRYARYRLTNGYLLHCRRHHQEVTADAGTSASSGGPNTIGPGYPHSAIDGNGVPTGAGGTGAIGSDGIGDHVTELASGRNSLRRRTLFRQIRRQIPPRGVIRAGF